MENNEDDKVPLFKTWNQWYIFLVVFLLILIFLFYWFTKFFA